MRVLGRHTVLGRARTVHNRRKILAYGKATQIIAMACAAAGNIGRINDSEAGFGRLGLIFCFGRKAALRQPLGL